MQGARGVQVIPVPAGKVGNSASSRADGVPRMPALDGLRALSVMAVIAHHVDDLGGRSFERLHGRLGVTVFFVLSGYLITRLALEEERRNGFLDLRAFFRRRIFRLLPVYAIVLALYVVLTMATGGPDNARRAAFTAELPFYILYLQDFPLLLGHPTAPFAFSWTLGVEEKFYLAWPLLCFVALGVNNPGRDTRRIMVSGTLALSLFAVPSLAGAADDAFRVSAGYGAIMLGCVLALVEVRPWGEVLSVRLSNGVVPVIAAGVLFFARGNVLIVALATCMVLPSLSRQRGAVSRLLSSRPLVWYGQRSYGVYLVHSLVLKLLVAGTVRLPDGVTRDTLLLAAGIIAAGGVAAVLYAFVERPSIAYGRRSGSQPSASA